MISSDKSFPVLRRSPGLAHAPLAWASVSEPGDGAVMGHTRSQGSLCLPHPTLSICCPGEPPTSLCGWTYYWSHDRYRSLGVPLSLFHSFIQQTHMHLLCAGH